MCKQAWANVLDGCHNVKLKEPVCQWHPTLSGLSFTTCSSTLGTVVKSLATILEEEEEEEQGEEQEEGGKNPCSFTLWPVFGSLVPGEPLWKNLQARYSIKASDWTGNAGLMTCLQRSRCWVGLQGGNLSHSHVCEEMSQIELVS